jgi:hypothetical protein
MHDHKKFQRRNARTSARNHKTSDGHDSCSNVGGSDAEQVWVMRQAREQRLQQSLQNRSRALSLREVQLVEQPAEFRPERRAKGDITRWADADVEDALRRWRIF